MLTTDRKRLAGGTTRNEFNALVPSGKINLSDINIEKIQFNTHAAQPILAQRAARVSIALNHCDRGKTGPMQPKCKAATAGEKFNRIHWYTFTAFQFSLQASLRSVLRLVLDEQGHVPKTEEAANRVVATECKPRDHGICSWIFLFSRMPPLI